MPHSILHASHNIKMSIREDKSTANAATAACTRKVVRVCAMKMYVGRGPKSNRTLNLARELEVVVRCAARCCGSTQYSSSLPRGVNLG